MNDFPLDNLPEEILEKVFSFTSSYNDFLNIRLVSKKWYRIINGLRKLEGKSFDECFKNGKIFWKSITTKFYPSKRHSHSCCRMNDCIYIFGGLSDTNTSFNDLWLLDLNTKTWSRPLSDGTYPSPKACASLIAYKSSLILFGGYSHPYQYPLNQQVNFFDELHVYCTKTCTWGSKFYPNEAPKLAGHTASIIDNDKMILFGGCNGSLNNKTNNIYCFSLTTFEWFRKEINGIRPESRYGHSQITIDDEHIVIVGGCGGPNHLYDDIWYLTLPKNSNNGYWQKIIIRQSFNAPTQLHCISLARCGDKLITFGRPKSQLNEIYSKRVCTCVSSIKKTESLKLPNTTSQIKIQNEDKKHINNKLLNKSDRNTAKRNEILKNMANKYIYSRMTSNESVNNKNIYNLITFTGSRVNQCIVHSKLMQVFVLNIKNLINNVCSKGQLLEVAWSEPIFSHINAPPNTILYSLTKGVNELLLFGGMEIDSTYSNNHNNNNKNNNNMQQQQYQEDNNNEIIRHKVCNELYIMKANNLFI